MRYVIFPAMKILIFSLVLVFSAPSWSFWKRQMRAKTINFSRSITPSSIDRLLKQIDDIKAKYQGQEKPFEVIISLNSPGGDINHTIRAVGRIRNLNQSQDLQIHTKVSAYSSCESACTILFTAGKIRYASERASFGFHSPDYKKGNRGGRSIKEIENIFREIWLGQIAVVDPEVSERLRSEGLLEDDRMSYIPARELTSGYVNRLF